MRLLPNGHKQVSKINDLHKLMSSNMPVLDIQGMYAEDRGM